LSNCLLQVATRISISFFILVVMVVAIGLIWSPDTGCQWLARGGRLEAARARAGTAPLGVAA
jgi:hypothetical protein